MEEKKEKKEKDSTTGKTMRIAAFLLPQSAEVPANSAFTRVPAGVPVPSSL